MDEGDRPAVFCATPPVARRRAALSWRRGHARLGDPARDPLPHRRGQSPEHARDLRAADRHHDRPGEPAPRVRDRRRSSAHREDHARCRRPRLLPWREALRVPRPWLEALPRPRTRRLPAGGGPRRLRPGGARSRASATLHEADHQDRRRLLLLGSRLHGEGERSRLHAGAHRAAGRARRTRGARAAAGDDGHAVRRHAPRDRVGVRAGGRTYVFPPLRPGTYRLRARLIGYEDAGADRRGARQGSPTRVAFTMAPTATPTSSSRRAPGSRSSSTSGRTRRTRGDFTLSCGNCHQIGGYRFRRAKTDDQWRTV